MMKKTAQQTALDNLRAEIKTQQDEVERIESVIQQTQSKVDQLRSEDTDAKNRQRDLIKLVDKLSGLVLLNRASETDQQALVEAQDELNTLAARVSHDKTIRDLERQIAGIQAVLNDEVVKLEALEAQHPKAEKAAKLAESSELIQTYIKQVDATMKTLAQLALLNEELDSVLFYSMTALSLPNPLLKEYEQNPGVFNDSSTALSFWDALEVSGYL